MKANGAALRAIRSSQHRSVRSVAEEVGIAHQVLSGLELGKRTVSLGTFTRLAKTLNTEVDAIAIREAS